MSPLSVAVPPPRLLTLLFSALLGMGGVACRQPMAPVASPAPVPSAASVPTGSQPAVTLWFMTRVQNTPEPCGCTSDPLGDVSRVAALVRASAERGLLLDAGALRYPPTPMPVAKRPQARLKADFLESTWRELGALVMLQPADLLGAQGASELAPRLATNVEGLPSDRQLRQVLRVLGGVPIGVIGLADPNVAWPAGLQVTDPVAAAGPAVAGLRTQGAALTVALTGLPREAARRLARRVPTLDVVVAGGDDALPEGVGQPEQIGNTLIVVPAIEAQRLVRLQLYRGGNGSLALTLRPTETQRNERAARLAEQEAQLQARLTALRADAQAEAEFVRATETDLERTRSELAALRQASMRSDEAYAEAELVAIGRSLPRDPIVAQAMKALDRRVGQANLAAAGAPVPALPGQPSYVGVSGCLGSCHFHDDAVAFWNKTRHAGSFTTLVQVGKELSYDCVHCHSIGFDEPGGSTLRTLSDWQRAPSDRPPPASRDLRHVGCEVCHGPGSAHVAAPSKKPIGTPKPTQDRCLVCHTKDHSDTFDWLPYLRDILGEGHGAERKAALPPGPTGHELRSAALKKRGAAGH